MSQPIQPWSKDKLDLLAKYLHAYSTIMQTQKAAWLRRYSFIDAFAGAGQFFDPETMEYVEGSPLVALECDPPFDAYWFIDLSPSKVEGLRGLVQSYVERDIRFRQGDANAILVNEVTAAIRFEHYERGIVFVDPYGLQVRWETIASLAETRALDLFINFPIMGINRLLPTAEAPAPTVTTLIGSILRDASWIESLYATQGGLFGDDRSTRGRLDAHRLAQQYIADVRTLFPHTSRAVVMRNSTNTPLYALFLASHNATATRITNETFQRFERLRLQ